MLDVGSLAAPLEPQLQDLGEGEPVKEAREKDSHRLLHVVSLLISFNYTQKLNANLDVQPSTSVKSALYKASSNDPREKENMVSTLPIQSIFITRC